MKKYENPSSFPSVVDPLIFFQDIDVPAREIYNTFQTLIAEERYSEAMEYINSQDNVDGYFAGLYNLLVTRLFNLQEHLKIMDTNLIYSDVPVESSYPYLHNGVIWINYDLATKHVASISDEQDVVEVIKPNMQMRLMTFIKETHIKRPLIIKSDSDEEEPDPVAVVTKDGQPIHVYKEADGNYMGRAIIPSNKVCYEDIYLDKNASLKDSLEEYVESNPSWTTERTYYHSEENVETIIVDNVEKQTLTTKGGLKIVTKQGEDLRTMYYEDIKFPTYCLGYKNELGTFPINTIDGKFIKIYPSENLITIYRIYDKQGNLLKAVNLPPHAPVLKTGEISFPDSNTDYIHAKFRALGNLPTMLWHRLSFATVENDAVMNDGSTVRSYLDTYKTRIDSNVSKILAKKPQLGIPEEVNTIGGMLDSYKDYKNLMVDTIQDITGEAANLNEDSTPTAIATYILYCMYSPIIAAAKRLAQRYHISAPDDDTMANAIHTLNKFRPPGKVYVVDENGDTYILTTKDGKIIKLKVEEVEP